VDLVTDRRVSCHCDAVTMVRPGSAAHDPVPERGARPEPRASSCGLPSFAAVYQQYFTFVWSSVRRLGVRPVATDDVVQEVFIVIHSRLHTLEHPESLRSWIYGVVRRTVSTHRRAQRTRDALGVRLAVEAESLHTQQRTPLDYSEQTNALSLLTAVLAELDDAKREVFELVELEELSVPEVAEMLDIPLNTAYSRLRAARHAFEAALQRRAERAGGK
jgi:RNA polymerase sigma-70 factor (ECF subfamily)